MMNLIPFNQFSKVRDHPLMFNKWRIFRISDIDHCFDGINVLLVKVSATKDMNVGRPRFGSALLHAKARASPRTYHTA
jgi:hypothetical protein